MTREPEAAYYLRRERAARLLAANAADPHIARIHHDLATKYADAARNAKRSDPRAEEERP